MEPCTKRRSPWAAFLVVVMLAAFSFMFLIIFISLSQNSGGTAVETLTASTYQDVVEPLLADADPARGVTYFTEYACQGCHREGGAAPTVAEIAANAADRRPPLTAAAYLYESILYPSAYVVEGYNDVMPRNYASIPDDELGDLIAYMLSPDVESD
jgi:mono/diheme cytochrome c family protein